MITRVAIVGSVNYPCQGLVQAYVAALPADAVVVSGGARGVDTYAEEAAKARGLKTLIFHADWKKLGRRAGPIRNGQIVAHPDRVVAFWNGSSRGTLSTLVQAHRADLPIEVYDPNGEALDLDYALNVADDQGVVAPIAAAEKRQSKLQHSEDS